MGQIVTYLLMVQKFTNLKQKILKFGNISKDWSVDNMKRTGFTGYAYEFSVDYEAIAADDIKNIHKYLMKKKNSMNTSAVIKKCSIYMMFIMQKNYESYV